MQDSSLVFLLKNYLYGLKQALRACYTKMYSYLLSHNFVRFKSDSNFYILGTIDSLLLLVGPQPSFEETLVRFGPTCGLRHDSRRWSAMVELRS
jgi:hypothetical protein